MKSNFKFFLLSLASLLFSTSLFAQPTESKTYQNYPIGMQILQTGYMRQTTNSTVDGLITLPNKNIDINVNGYFFRYVNFFKLGNVGAGLQVALPFIDIDANILGVNAKNSGLGDAILAFGTTLVGMKPPLAFIEFTKRPKEFCLGWAIMITMPTGSYDTDILLNPGGNRWQFRPELGMSIPLGKWDFEANINLRFFTKNPQLPALVQGSPSVSLGQKAMTGITSHLVYNASQKFWISFDLAGRLGGQTAKNGIWQQDAQALLAIGGAAAYSPSIHHTFGTSFITNASGNSYSPKGHIFSLKYSYIFGREINKVVQAMRLKNKDYPLKN